MHHRSIDRPVTKAISRKISAAGSTVSIASKFLDIHEMLSVQVHPPDQQVDLIPKGETGKTGGVGDP